MSIQRYVMSSAVLTGPGTFEYALIDTERAREWLRVHAYTSALRFVQSADALALLTGEHVPVSREFCELAVGDEALVYRLKVPMSTVSSSQLQRIDYVTRNSELGLLRRIQ